VFSHLPIAHYKMAASIPCKSETPEYNVRYLVDNEKHVEQHEESVEVTFLSLPSQPVQTIRIQDYDLLYPHPGLYEKIVHQDLRCNSPHTMINLLRTSMASACDLPPTDESSTSQTLSILDMAAGTGLVSAELSVQFPSRIQYIAGVDIEPTARDAALRDHPGLYDEYHITDLSVPANLDPLRESVTRRGRAGFDIVTMCSALGHERAYEALVNACTLLTEGGWVVATVSEAGLKLWRGAQGPWGEFCRELESEVVGERLMGMKVVVRERFFHRLNITGGEIFYWGLILRKD